MIARGAAAKASWSQARVPHAKRRPSMRLPGSPMRGAEPALAGSFGLAARIAGSFKIASSPNEADDEIIELRDG